MTDTRKEFGLKESLTTAEQQKVAAALKWSAENKPGHGLHDVPGVGLVHFNDGSDPAPETLARWEREEGMSQAAADVLAARRRQVAKGYDAAHDDEHVHGELGLAAALYLLPYEATFGGEPLIKQEDHIGLDMALDLTCGWEIEPIQDRRERLVAGVAMGIAEIERLDRAAQAEREG